MRTGGTGDGEEEEDDDDGDDGHAAAAAANGCGNGDYSSDCIDLNEGTATCALLLPAKPAQTTTLNTQPKAQTNALRPKALNPEP